MISCFLDQDLLRSINPAGNRLANQMRDAHDEGVSHAERAIDIRHAGVRPAFREALQLIKLVRDQPTIPAVSRCDDMLAARSRHPPHL